MTHTPSSASAPQEAAPQGLLCRHRGISFCFRVGNVVHLLGGAHLLGPVVRKSITVMLCEYVLPDCIYRGVLWVVEVTDQGFFGLVGYQGVVYDALVIGPSLLHIGVESRLLRTVREPVLAKLHKCWCFAQAFFQLQVVDGHVG